MGLPCQICHSWNAISLSRVPRWNSHPRLSLRLCRHLVRSLSLSQTRTHMAHTQACTHIHIANTYTLYTLFTHFTYSRIVKDDQTNLQHHLSTKRTIQTLSRLYPPASSIKLPCAYVFWVKGKQSNSLPPVVMGGWRERCREEKKVCHLWQPDAQGCASSLQTCAFPSVYPRSYR